MTKSDSDLSDREDNLEKHRYRKSRHMAEKDIKRKRSKSGDRNNYEKIRKKKSRPRENSESGSSNNEMAYRSKSKDYRKKENKVLKRDQNKKDTPITIDSDSEGEIKNISKNRKGRDQKSKRSRRSNSLDVSQNGKYENQLSLQSKTTHDYKSRYQNHNENDNDQGNYRGLSDKQNKNIKDKYSNNKKEINTRTSENEDRKGELYESRKRSKYDENKLRDRLDKGCSLPNGDEDDKSINSSNEKKQCRYWSNSRGPVRKNSDSYWNKYSDRLKESTENMEVGPRYYGSGENLRKDKTIDNSAKDKKQDNTETDKEAPKNVITPKQKKIVDLFTSRAGGAYIPPAKLKMMQESITDKASAAYQRLAWEALKKSIQGHINKVNTANIRVILKATMKENIVRGRGLLCRALIQAQAASPSFTNVYAAFIAVLNAKFPQLGELLLKRLVVQFRRGFKRNDKTICITAATFIAHLVNQEVAHEIIALEILTLLLETPTDDSVEVSIAFLKECGMKLTEVSNKGVLAIFDMLRNILHEGKLEKRVQYMIEVMFQIRKEDFKAHPSVIEDLDLVDEEDRVQHMITIEENHDPQDILNVFKLDPDYEANEAKYKALVDESDEESGEGDSSGSGDSDGDESDEEDEENVEDKGVIVDKTETNLVALRKTIYLTIQSSLDFEECAHKLLRMQLKPGQEIEMAHMFLDCCAEQRTYEKFFGLLSQRFCQINRLYVGPFEETFRDSYATIHRMPNDKLRNVAKLFAHLLYTDAISWDVLATIRLNEDDTTSSSRIFIKILFLELSEYMGLAKLNQRVKDPSLQMALEGLFPRDNPKNTRFAINFFTSIGLGGLTDELREHLKAQPKQSIAVPQLVEGLSSSSSSSSESSSESSDSSDSSPDSSSTDSSSSDSEDSYVRKKKNQKLVRKKKNQPVKKIERIKSSNKIRDSPPKRKQKR